jgi:hypothetical protein
MRRAPLPSFRAPRRIPVLQLVKESKMNVEELLKGVLAKDEIVKWSTVPKPYSVLNEENKKSTMLFWSAAAAVLLVLNIVYIALCALSETAEFIPGVLVVTVGVPAFLFINPIRDKMHIAKQIAAVTDRRAIVFHKSNKAQSVAIEEIDAVRVEQSTDAGCCHVRIGSSVTDAPAAKLRHFAVMGKRDNDDKCVGLVFYHIDEAEGKYVYNLLNENAALKNA